MGKKDATNVLGLAAYIHEEKLITYYGNLGNFLKLGFLLSLKASLPS